MSLVTMYLYMHKGKNQGKVILERQIICYEQSPVNLSLDQIV